MSTEIFLPKPTEDELTMSGKVEYFARLLPMDLDTKYKITQTELCDWIHHNYQGIYLLNEEISLGALRKLMR